ncbi:MAG: polyprenyl synthetase family protein [Bacteroidales bacterium]|nr:polyprenyl synthetase family protein [Bacteroidales bacterium]
MKTIDQNHLLELVETGLAEIKYPERTPGLVRPIAYTLEAGGKRLRPLFVLAACQAVCGDAERALRQALAVEMFHNFTLIHDDVMDNADRRRGRLTVHRRWGAVQAILSGDALLTMATQYVADCDRSVLPEVLDLFNRTAMEVYEGQQLDTEFEKLDRVTVARYIEMIRLKTSVLLGCACRMGALVGGADDVVQQAMYDFGMNLGVAFQLRDDWLDTFGDPAVFGKSIGGDIVNRKKTWLYITACREAHDQMARAYERGTTKGRLVGGVKKIYEQLDLSCRCDALISEYCEKALESLDRACLDAESCDWFADLAHKLSSRAK